MLDITVFKNSTLKKALLTGYSMLNSKIKLFLCACVAMSVVVFAELYTCRYGDVFHTGCLVLKVNKQSPYYSSTSDKYNTNETVPILRASENGRITSSPSDDVIRKRLCRGKGILPETNVSIRKDWDFVVRTPFDLLPNYKNPCFFENTTGSNESAVTSGERRNIRCLPYFMIGGFPKSATTDMWHHLGSHPDIALPHWKEPMFINRGRFSKKSEDNVMAYIGHYDAAAKIIAAHFSRNGTVLYHPAITGEGSVDTCFDNNHWPQLPGNEGCVEPVLTNADYMHRLNPDMKLIFLLRNPVERLYSDYLFEARFIRYELSQNDFNETLTEGIRMLDDCLKYYTWRGCAYNRTMDIKGFKLRLRVGLYHLYLEDWMRVFPKKQILVLKTEDLASNNSTKLAMYEKVFRFLGAKPLDGKARLMLLGGRRNARSKKEEEIGDMLPESRKIANEFYAPFNKRLAEMLNDDRFLWSD